MKQKKPDKLPNIHRQHLMDYLAGRLDAAERYRLERSAMSDPFLSDAMDGLSKFDPQAVAGDLAQLDASLAAGKKRRMVPLFLKIASVVLLLIPGAIFWLTMDHGVRHNELAYKSEVFVLGDTSTFPAGDSIVAVDKQLTSDAAPAVTVNRPMVALNKEVEEVEPSKAEAADEVTTTEMEEAELVVEAKAEAEAAEVTRPVALSFGRAKTAIGGNSVQGRVTDNEGQPVAGAVVSAKAAGNNVVTDADGRFNLHFANKQDTVQVSLIGYNKVEKATRPDTDLNFEVTPELLALEEVVVAGRSAKKSESARPSVRLMEKSATQTVAVGAKPAIGWAQYQKYINENLRYPKIPNPSKEIVVVEVQVLPSGEVGDVEIVKSPGSAFSDEAIRVIKEGPRWLPATLNGNPTNGNVKLKVRFIL